MLVKPGELSPKQVQMYATNKLAYQPPAARLVGDWASYKGPGRVLLHRSPLAS